MEHSEISPGKRGLRAASFASFILGLTMSIFSPVLLWYATVSFGGGTGVSLLFVIGMIMTFTSWIPVVVSCILTFLLSRRGVEQLWWQPINLVLLILWALGGILAFVFLR